VGELSDDTEVTVCDACKTAACWLGVFMCDDSRGAGTVQVTVAELRELGEEHQDYWVRCLKEEGRYTEEVAGE
jgi:hypothetical protein